MPRTIVLRFAVCLAMCSLAAIPTGCEQSTEARPAAFAGIIGDFDANLARELERAAAEDAERASVESILRQPRPLLEATDGMGLGHVELLRRLYGARENSLTWVDPSVEKAGLTTSGESLLATLLEAESMHGLWQEDYHVDEITNLLQSTGDPNLVPLAGLSLTEEERSTLRHVLGKKPALASGGVETLARAAAAGSLGLPRLQKLVEERKRAISLTAETKARLDVLLSDALIRYGHEMRWNNPAHYASVAWPEELAVDDKYTDEKRDLIAHRELDPVFRDVDKVHALLRDLPPTHPQYRRLTEAFKTYSKFADGPEWPVIPQSAGRLRVGSEGENVVLLKERLAAEGYWDGDMNETFTGSLGEALTTYQRTHQLWEEAALTPETRTSLNIPAWRRRDQIRLTLQRWRESRLGADGTYVHVNIPDFHGEVWRDGERVKRFRVVTGSTAKKWNGKLGKNILTNPTPLMSDMIEHVVFNPYWNVPDGIRKTELEPKLEEDPLYFVRKDFEYVTEENGRTFLRQNPGPENALGLVKFLFPNKHDVYLHDTPDKEYFKYPVRAFSHGCVRVENPMELAEDLLATSGQWDEQDVASWLERDTETWIKLENPIPVHIEYYVVRIDDLGRTNFLADVYQLDGPRLAEINKRLKARSEASKAVDVPATGSTTAIVH